MEIYSQGWATQRLRGKESACNAKDAGSILGREDPLEKEINYTLLQYSCLENSMDRGAWRATVHKVTESHTAEHTYIAKGAG